MPNVPLVPGATPGQLPLGANPGGLPLGANPGALPQGAAPGALAQGANGGGFSGLLMSPGTSSGGAMGTLPGGSTPIPGLPTTYSPYGSFTDPSGALPNAPTPTPYGTFTAPDPANFQHSPSFQYDLDQAQKAIQKSAAARGTLLTGGTLRSLQGNAIGLASRDYQNAFNNAASVYGLNRDTNALNFGQAHTAYGDELAGHQAEFGNAVTGYDTNRVTNALNFNQARELGAFQPLPGPANPPAVGMVGGGDPGSDYASSIAAQRAGSLGTLPGGGGAKRLPTFLGGANGLPAQTDTARILAAGGRLLGR